MREEFFVLGWMFVAILLFLMPETILLAANWQPLTDTDQTECYSVDGKKITCPKPGQPLYGQDAQYHSLRPSFMNNGDDTITDMNTGLMWMNTFADIYVGSVEWDVLPYQEAIDYCNNLIFANYDDWRLPEIFELESIVDYGNGSWSFIGSGGENIMSLLEMWSATTCSFNTTSAWGIGVSGFSVVYDKANTFNVRCVREGL
jgi:hypothetical protein